MRRFNLHSRLALALAGTTAVSCILIFFVGHVCVKRTVTGFQVEALTRSEAQVSEEVERARLIEMGIPETALAAFEKSPLGRQGFVIKKIFENTIIQVEKSADGQLVSHQAF